MYAILIPAYNPDHRLLEIVAGLGAGREPVVVVDDGSSSRCRAVFERIAEGGTVSVLRHETNRGKGCAIRTGLDHILRRHPTVDGVVTMDADGQHAVRDARTVGAALAPGRRELVIGARNGAGGIPLRSRLGNTLTSIVFSALTGAKMRDTQTGLRAIPLGLAPEILALGGERYEYEMEMLCHCRIRGIPIVEVPIETRYFDRNEASHFSPSRDSARIVRVLLRNVIGLVRGRLATPPAG